jgi:2-polyprenyl-3-methyl-5-hydroxy-6-metoxy-1,4-benzoquinol methylase
MVAVRNVNGLIRMDCCKPDYDTVFSEKRAAKDLKRYRRKGPDTTTQLLIDALKSAGVRGKTLLDVGGGIGVIDHELLEAGAESAVHVEASEAFVRAATEEADRRGFAGRVQFRRGDFVALAREVDEADMVTLDRVICCYPDVQQLVTASARCAREAYGIVIPRERRLTRLMELGINVIFRITRNPFRFYVHPPGDIDRILERAGLSRRFMEDTLIWRVAVYARVPRTAPN